MQSIDAQAEPVLIVKVLAPLAAVKKTVSPATGKEAPEAPPSDALQLVVLFQLPVPPPMKYLAAISSQRLMNLHHPYQWQLEDSS